MWDPENKSMSYRTKLQWTLTVSYKDFWEQIMFLNFKFRNDFWLSLAPKMVGILTIETVTIYTVSLGNYYEG